MSVANSGLAVAVNVLQERIIPVTIPYTILDTTIADGVQTTLFSGKPEVGVYGKYSFNLSFSVSTAAAILDSQYTLVNTNLSTALTNPSNPYVTREVTISSGGATEAHFNISATVEVTASSGDIEIKYTPITGGPNAVVQQAVLVWTRTYKY
jgi:hypothetical protein